MRILFLLARRQPPVPSPLLEEVATTLRSRGFEVDGVIAEEHLFSPDRLAASYDLYVLKSHTELSLSLAGALAAGGARILNPYRACAAAQNKIVAARLLRDAGVPIPDCWVGNAASLAELIAQHPVVAKPYQGHRGVGVRLIRSPSELAALGDASIPLIFQRYVAGCGEDLKVYVVADEVMAVRKPFSPDSFSRPGRPVEVTEQVRAIARAVGSAFGLGLFGLDMIETPHGPVVVDLNYFPGYKGLPQAAALVARYIERFALGSIELTYRDVCESVG
ncbi:MAG: ATP-grasp domain-containing protein [Acidimicrobiia bacterium]|nr:ATP-grasp domain-containing protein [Acidimicrobiia bacterium]